VGVSGLVLFPLSCCASVPRSGLADRDSVFGPDLLSLRPRASAGLCPVLAANMSLVALGIVASPLSGSLGESHPATVRAITTVKGASNSRINVLWSEGSLMSKNHLGNDKSL